jgi:hypothetical protein
MTDRHDAETRSGAHCSARAAARHVPDCDAECDPAAIRLGCLGLGRLLSRRGWEVTAAERRTRPADAAGGMGCRSFCPTVRPHHAYSRLCAEWASLLAPVRGDRGEVGASTRPVERRGGWFNSDWPGCMAETAGTAVRLYFSTATAS